jgi:hypothetical protein
LSFEYHQKNIEARVIEIRFLISGLSILEQLAQIVAKQTHRGATPGVVGAPIGHTPQPPRTGLLRLRCTAPQGVSSSCTCP